MTAYQTLPTDAGVIHAHEYVNFIREPHNPYDRNAIRVVNMAGIQVGLHTALRNHLVLSQCFACQTHSNTLMIVTAAANWHDGAVVLIT
jgi:HIRAN domain